MAFRKFRPIPPMSERQLDSFHSLIPPSLPPDVCWPWKGRTLTPRPYGVFSITGAGEFNATRIMMKLTTGVDPGELWVLHRCDNPICINPAHLFLGTYQDNVDDMVKKGRHMHGDRHYLRQHPRRGSEHCNSLLTEAQVLEMRALYAAGGWTQEKLGFRYGVSEACINKIVARTHWTHI